MKIVHTSKVTGIWPLHDPSLLAPIINVMLCDEDNPRSVVKFANIDEDWRAWSKDDIQRLVLGLQIALDEMSHSEEMQAFVIKTSE